MEEPNSRWQDIKQNLGCFIPTVILLVLVSYALHSFLPLVFIFLLLVFSKNLKKIFSGIIGFSGFAFVAIFAIAWLYSVFSKSRDVNITLPEDGSDETTEIQYDANGGPDSVWVVHHRKWYTYHEVDFTGDLAVSKTDYLMMKSYRERLQYDNNNFWPSVYQPLSEDKKQRLKKVYDMYSALLKQKPMSREEFAEMIVCSIQDIPYVLVVDGDCDAFKKTKEEYANYDCLGYARFGLQSPPEFIYNLKGDCDTRALLLYTVLSKFGYDVAILTSETYSHAILGINLPCTGSFKEFNGKKYYTWETTAAGCIPGYISQEWSDMNQWSINLVSQP